MLYLSTLGSDLRLLVWCIIYFLLDWRVVPVCEWSVRCTIKWNVGVYGYLAVWTCWVNRVSAGVNVAVKCGFIITYSSLMILANRLLGLTQLILLLVVNINESFVPQILVIVFPNLLEFVVNLRSDERSLVVTGIR